MKTKVEYWTMWEKYSFCSAHRTAKAALRAAKACEEIGGSPHRIFKVTEIRRGKTS